MLVFLTTFLAILPSILRSRAAVGLENLQQLYVRRNRVPSRKLATFLDNHAQQLLSIDFFSAPTIRFQVLCVFLVARDLVTHPTAERKRLDRLWL